MLPQVYCFWMKMEMEFVILPVTMTMTVYPTVKTQIGPSLKMAQIIKMETGAIPLPAKRETDMVSAAEMPGTIIPSGRIVTVSETVSVMALVRRVKDQEKVKAKADQSEGEAHLSSFREEKEAQFLSPLLRRRT